MKVLSLGLQGTLSYFLVKQLSPFSIDEALFSKFPVRTQTKCLISFSFRTSFPTALFRAVVFGRFGPRCFSSRSSRQLKSPLPFSYVIPNHFFFLLAALFE